MSLPEDPVFLGAKWGEVGCQVQGGVRDGGGTAKAPEAGGGGVSDEGRVNHQGGSHGAVRAPWKPSGAVCEAARGDKGGLTNGISNRVCHGQTRRVDVMDG